LVERLVKTVALYLWCFSRMLFERQHAPRRLTENVWEVS
jgi:hypothetical protein